MSYNTNKEALITIENINQDQRLYKIFKKEFPNNTLTQLWDAIKADLLNPDLRKKLILICPPMYKIGKKVFLYGDDTRKVNYTGDNLDEDEYQSAIELYDMTTEMKTGNSYTFYVSTVEYFDRPTPKECADARIYLESIK